MTKVAVIQKPPVFSNKEKTIKRAVASVVEVASESAELIIFPETYIPGYPA